MATVKFCRGTYKKLYEENPIFHDGMFILVMALPWYRSWFGLKPNRLALGDGKTEFKKLKYL